MNSISASLNYQPVESIEQASSVGDTKQKRPIIGSDQYTVCPNCGQRVIMTELETHMKSE